ncbi:MAG: hypothetical protein IT238_08250 [Bacteroidia bacterium]|nr:hypothetical protein [Bacteroidia bacterium]MCZ2248581.1 hypothetical protein [Bacteroidia bacterium]
MKTPKQFLILLVVILFGGLEIGSAQNISDQLKWIKSINISSRIISCDNIGNLYAVAQQEILKYDNNGNLLQKNSVKNWGELYQLDVSNPMKIIAYYKDYNKIVFFDNMLANTGNSIDLSELGYDQATLVCNSHDNGLWLYNSINFELVRFDLALKVTHQSGNIAQLTNTNINPSILIENNNKVYLCDSVNGVFVFDIFGTYIKTIPLRNINSLQVVNDVLYFRNKEGFGSFNSVLLKQEEIFFPDDDILQVSLQKGRVYMRYSDKIAIYNYK